ncbi:MAG TPA: helix-turn-helix transcriptional regulator, partial [Sphingopyxis sp.]|nr:helix-turn-helix transcriptional regulator [Sphingopyxis sp.]
MARQRIFAGTRLKQLRIERGTMQAAFAQQLGISTSYLSQIEHDDRPLTPA